MRWLVVSAMAWASSLGVVEPSLAADTHDAGGAVTLDGLLSQFRAMPGLYARYREEKHIALLAAPLVGEGTVHFAPPRRIARHARTPAPSSVVFDGSLLRFGDAKGEQRIDVGANPVVSAFIETFLDVLVGDRARLERTFVVAFHAGDAAHPGDRWDLTLVPRAPSLLAVLKEVRFAGQGVLVSEMRIVEATGDEGVTTFSDVDTAHRYSAQEASHVFRVSGDDGT